MAEAVPVRTSLADLYPSDALVAEESRWSKLRSTFRSTFGHDPIFVARSPGRVNLLGEHIDYSMYDCLPAGIAADVVIAVSTGASSRPAKFEVHSVHPDKFEPRAFSLNEDDEVDIDPSEHHWTNYFKAGVRGALLIKSERSPGPPASMSVLIDGTVPAGGGLSSSAALVCASALSVLYANGVPEISKRTLVELAIVCERSVGVNSGGLDQTGSVCSRIGCALHVSFSPKLSAEAIPFPKTDPPFAIMTAQSFVESNKRVTGPVCYNLRVVEVTLAAQYMASKLGLEPEGDESPLNHSLRGLQLAYFEAGKPPSGLKDEKQKLEHMLELVDKYLPNPAGYDRTEISDVLQIPVPRLEEQYMTKFPVRGERFLLRQRAQHVFSEAIRVQDFIALLKAPPPTSRSDGEDLLRKLGDLMNATQASCRDVYECSCPELDELCAIARRAGSYGSRLTGAGWGGCSVHLVSKDKVDDVRTAWHKEYYEKRFPDMEKEKLEQAVVVTEPGHGAMSEYSAKPRVFSSSSASLEAMNALPTSRNCIHTCLHLREAWITSGWMIDPQGARDAAKCLPLCIQHFHGTRLDGQFRINCPRHQLGHIAHQPPSFCTTLPKILNRTKPGTKPMKDHLYMK